MYDATGSRVSSLLRGERLEAGAHSVQWQALAPDGRRLPSGVYLYRLDALGESLARKMLIVK